jgi:hypothetical protein
MPGKQCQSTFSLVGHTWVYKNNNTCNKRTKARNRCGLVWWIPKSQPRAWRAPLDTGPYRKQANVEVRLLEN